MIDIHTHILPCIDDGSQSVEETAQMLDFMKNSGINKVVATPHFYGEAQNLNHFLENRKIAYEETLGVIPEGMDVYLGAEVKLFYDIHKLDLRKLAIRGTNHILVEMPYDVWDPWVYDELFKISAKHTLDIIIAHVDRYYAMVKSESIDKLFDMNLKYQVNLDDLGSLFKKSPALKLLKNGKVDYIASDCHNMNYRLPWLASKADIVRKKLGSKVIEKCMENADNMLNGI